MTLNGKSINAQESLHGGRLLVRLQTQSRLRVEQGGRVAAGAVADAEPVGLRFRLPVSVTVPRQSPARLWPLRVRCECEEEAPAEDIRSRRVLGARKVHLFSASMR